MAPRARSQDSIITGSKKDAEDFQARKRAQVERAEATLAPARTAPKFSDFCVEIYAAHGQMQLRASTWAVRQYQLATLIQHLGDLRLTAIDNATVEAYKRTRHRTGRKARTINNELAVLQAVLSYASRIGTPCTKPAFLFLRTSKSSRAKTWTNDEVRRLFDATTEFSPALTPLIAFLVNTGCRARA